MPATSNLRFVVVLAALLQEPLKLRPWAGFQSSADQLKDRLREARTPEPLLEIASWCEQQGKFADMAGVLRQVLKTDSANDTAHRLRGDKQIDGRWSAEEAARFEEQAVVAPFSMPGLSDAQKAALLRLKDRDLRVAGSTGVFDLQTDLADDGVAIYHKLFNGYYRRLKHRFSVWAGGKVDVLVFANRSDFLHYYRRTIGTGGEHVSGFYSQRLLALHDDVENRDDVLNTARHECTHLVMDLCYEGPDLPLWLNEGMACYFAGECEAALGNYTAGLLDHVRTAIRGRTEGAWQRVMLKDRGEFKFEDYALSWSFIYFLNTDAHEKKFQQFLGDLRKVLTADTAAEECCAKANELFLTMFGPDLSALEKDWARFFSDTFSLTSAQQAVDFATFLLLTKGHDKAVDHEISIDQALLVQAAIGSPSEAGIARQVAENRIWALVQRISLMTLDAEALRLGLRSVLQSLRGLPVQDNGMFHARLSIAALQQIRDFLKAPKRVAGSFDCRARLLETVKSAPDDSAQTLRSLVVLHDDLLQMAGAMLQQSLAAEPLRKQALHDWLRLSTDISPSGIEPVFPRLKLLVEIEPDDRNLAAYAVCYKTLGDGKWANMLWEEAKSRSLHVDSLWRFADYFEPSASTK